MTRIEVVPADLTDLATKLSAIHDGMKGAVGGAGGGAADQCVVDAANHFHDKWDYSMGKISDSAGTAAGNLRNAATGYDNADHSLSPSGDGGSSGNG